MATKAQRQHLASLMDFLVEKEAWVHYPYGDHRTAFDARSFNLSEQQMEHLILGGGSIQADCSEMVTELCKWTGLQDPNGVHYKYAGYTGSMLANRNMVHYTKPTTAEVGAFVVFGPGTGDHVCMVRKPGKNPLLFSHGQEKGPIYIDLDTESSYHRSPVTFLSIARL